MKQLADGVYQLRGFPPDAINVYLVEDVLVDAATRQGTRRIMRQIEGHRISLHVLTHAHPDHQGASKAVCEARGVELWCGEGDADAMEQGTISTSQAPGIVNKLQKRFWTGPPHPVAKRLREGDEVAGFTVLDVPGHSPGHVAYWREGDGTLILGDVLNNMDVRTGIPGLREPLPVFTPDPERNRQSIRKLAALEPELVLFGHGRPLHDGAAEKLRAFADRLP